MAQFNWTCSAPSEPPTDDYTDSLTVTLAAIEQPGVNAAPSPVWFEVANVTGCDAADPGVGEVRNPKYHDLTYVWDFGDVDNATPSTAAILSMPTVWKNINVAYGKRAAHVYNDPSPPGGYTVTVTVYERSTRRKGSATTTVTVGDPRTVFPGTRTIVWDPLGTAPDLSVYGYGSAQRLTGAWSTVTAARSDGARNGQLCQILLAPGAVHNLGASRLVSDPSWPNIRIGALDPTGTKPRIVRDNTASAEVVRDYNTTTNQERVVFGLRFEGPWDAATETGPFIRPFNTFGQNVASYLAMSHRCEFDGWAVVNASLSGPGSGQLLYQVHSELHVTNWGDYALHGVNRGSGSAYTAVIACKTTQHVDALSGGRDSREFHNEHGCIRLFSDNDTYIGVCDMLSRNGWSLGNTGPDGLAATANQPTIRLNTEAVQGATANVERVVSEGWIGMENRTGAGPERPGNYVYDKIIQVLGAKTGPRPHGFRIKYGGTTCRNVLQHVVNVPPAQSVGFSEGFFTTVEDDTGNTTNKTAAVEIYNCTLVEHRTNTNANSVTVQHVKNGAGANAFDALNAFNNVMHQPNRSPAITEGPLDLTTAVGGVVGRDKGPRYNFLHEEFTLASDVLNNGSILIPYSDLKTTRTQFSTPVDNGTVTDQAYWNTHLGTRHKVRVGTNATNNSTIWHSTYTPGTARIEVDPPEATGIRVWNRTGTTWPTGNIFQVQLERTTALPAFDPQYSSVGFTATTAELQAGHAGLGDGDTGAKAYDDLLMTVRPSTGDDRGALLSA
jgi:hypothetical protein